MHLLPGFIRELLVELAQHAFGRADQILRTRLAHFLKRRFGGNAAIHDPGSPGLAVETLDLGQDSTCVSQARSA